MKNLKSKSLYLVFVTITVLTFVLLNSCKDDDAVTSSTISSGVNGKWQFTITPLNNYIDTTTIKGKNGNDFQISPCINDEIYLYESNGQVLGFSGPFQLRGSMTDSIRLEVFEPVDGRYGEDTSMIKASVMTLSQNEMGHLVGKGNIILDHDTTGVSNDTYTIFGIKTGNISPEEFENLKLASRSTWDQLLCDAATDALNYLISKLTDNAFRPMSGCYAHKDGGGYWIFGKEGPGSAFPIWTQTVYYPMEWSFCKVRAYNFQINYDGTVRSIEVLEDLVKAQASFYNRLGFHSDSVIVAEIGNFYNIYGDFAITMAFDEETRNAAIYVNVENGDPNAHTHNLIQTMANANPLGCNLFFASGRNISDSWHLRRSDAFVCNTSLLFCYLFGTANVSYD